MSASPTSKRTGAWFSGALRASSIVSRTTYLFFDARRSRSAEPLCHPSQGATAQLPTQRPSRSPHQGGCTPERTPGPPQPAAGTRTFRHRAPPAVPGKEYSLLPEPQGLLTGSVDADPLPRDNNRRLRRWRGDGEDRKEDNAYKRATWSLVTFSRFNAYFPLADLAIAHYNLSRIQALVSR
jgi:hypothetical protein